MKTVRPDRRQEMMRTSPKACVLGLEHEPRGLKKSCRKLTKTVMPRAYWNTLISLKRISVCFLFW